MSGAVTPPARAVRVLIASYLEPQHVEEIRGVPGVQVAYEPALLAPPRYAADHHGGPFRRSPGDEARWRALLAEAEVLFDFDVANLEALPRLAPNVRWVQATSAGIGQLLARTGLIGTDIVFTTASGVHAGPLADFVLLGMLWFLKDAPRLIRDQRARRWERYCGRELQGMTLGVVGLGRVGREIARRGQAMGMRVLGVRRSPKGPDEVPVDGLLGPRDLPRLLAEADFVVLIVPHTAETEGMIGPRELALMKPTAVLINIARGAIVDEPALVEALRGGRLGGAVLDVAATEPLPPDSPLWEMPNVLISPHSASTADTENAKLTALFCENLRRHIRGERLANVFDRQRRY